MWSQPAMSKLYTPSADAVVRARVWRGRNELHCVMILEKSRLFNHHILLRAQTRHVVNVDGHHCGRQEGGSQNSTTCSVEYSRVGSKTDGAAAVVLGA